MTDLAATILFWWLGANVVLFFILLFYDWLRQRRDARRHLSYDPLQ